METMMQAWRIPAIAVSAAVIGCLSGPVAAQQQPLDTARQTVIQTTNEGRQSQDRIDEIASDTQEVVSNYRSTLRRIEDLKIYNDRMRKLIAQQETDMASIREQTERVKTVEREIVPLMIRMTDALEAFIKLDVPFQLEERLSRIAKLRETQDRADVATSEKFRLVLEAYQIENDYGRKIAYYQGRLGDGDDAREVEFLTVGRAAFYYQTRDQKDSGIWNNRDKRWEKLSSSQGAQVRTAMDMAQEIIPPDLMILPIFGASEGAAIDIGAMSREDDSAGGEEDAGDGDAGGDDGSSPDDSNSN